MCNLYQMTTKDDLEVYIREQLRLGLLLPPFEPLFVGPFGAGLFLRPGQDGGLVGEIGQWGLIRSGQPERIDYMPSKVPGKKGRPRSTNNARIEGIEKKTTFGPAWNAGRRCLIPAAWYQEPNWETGKNIWWRLRRADGLPWFIAGLWSEWHDHDTGEIVPNYTAITVNCDSHPMLARLHKPERDKETGDLLPPDQQDKRSLVHIEPADWRTWLLGTEAEARALLTPQPAEVFDQTDAETTNAALAAQRPDPKLF